MCVQCSYIKVTNWFKLEYYNLYLSYVFKNYNTQTCGLGTTKCKIDNLIFILLMEYYIYIFVSNLV